MDFTLNNYPADSAEGTIRSVAFGLGTFAAAILIEATPSEESETGFDLKITSDVGASNSESPAVLAETLSYVVEVLSNPEFLTAWAEIQDDNEEENA